jgi:hypothetical protein
VLVPARDTSTRRELLDYDSRSGSMSRPTTPTAAFKVDTHDDLVTELGLAVQGDRPKVGITQSNYRGMIRID